MTTSSHHKVCHSQSIPNGKMKRFDINDTAILLCNVDGTFYCVDDMCTHEDASLYLGCLKGKEVQCSLHGGRFDVTTGLATVEPAEVPLQTYPVSINDEGDVFVQLG